MSRIPVTMNSSGCRCPWTPHKTVKQTLISQQHYQPHININANTINTKRILHQNSSKIAHGKKITKFSRSIKSMKFLMETKQFRIVIIIVISISQSHSHFHPHASLFTPPLSSLNMNSSKIAHGHPHSLVGN